MSDEQSVQQTTDNDEENRLRAQVALLRDAVRLLVDAVEILGLTAEFEYAPHGDTKREALDVGYAALRKTNR